MNEIDAQKGKFLMRRIEYTPDYANIYCDINIKWLQEIYFKSIICMPKMLFGENEFSKYHIFSNFISIDLEEWLNLMCKVTSSFRLNNELRSKIIKNVNEYLSLAEKFIDNIYFKLYVNKILPTPQDLYECFKYFFQMDAFAIFNMCIPSNYYDDFFKEIKIDNKYSNIDLVMVCSFLPHRIQARKNKLELLKDYINKKENLEDKVKEYMLNCSIYERFEATIFDNSFIKDDIYLKRELKNMSNKYTIEQIEQEILDIKNNRSRQIDNMKKFYEKLDLSISTMSESEKKNVIRIFTFLTLIVSEEERRHMIECKIFAIIAEVFNNVNIDISRAKIAEIVSVYKTLRRES